MKIIIKGNYHAEVTNKLLGYVGEINSREIAVEGYEINEADLYKLRLSYTDGTQYDVTIMNGKATVTPSMLFIDGIVRMQVLAVKVVGDSYKYIKKTNIIEGKVEPSVDGSEPVPTYEDSVDVLEKILVADSTAKESAESAKGFADEARQNAELSANSATAAKQSEISAANSARSAADSAESADFDSQSTAADRVAVVAAKKAVESAAAQVSADRSAVEAAEDSAQAAAENAKASADSAAVSAETATAAKVAAEGAKLAAERSEQSAATSKTTAEKAAERAAQSELNAKASESNAALSAVRAAGSATQAEQSKVSAAESADVANAAKVVAETAKVGAESAAQTAVDKVAEIADSAEQIEALSNDISNIKYADYTDKTGVITYNAFLHYNTGAVVSNVNGASYCIIDVNAKEIYQIKCLLIANCGIIGYDSSGSRTFGFNNANDSDYKIGTNFYEVTIPDGTTKLGVSTRNQNVPVSIMLKQLLIYDFAAMENTVDGVSFDMENINDRLYALETRTRFAWRPFDTGKVIFMTDDALNDIGVITSLLMNMYQFPMSYACITSKLNDPVAENENGYATVKDVLIASQEFGGEVFSHSVDYNDWGTNASTNGGYNGVVPLDVSENRLRTSKQALRKLGIKCNGFVSPRGSNVFNYGEQVSKYYRYAYYQGEDIPQIYHISRTNIKQMSLVDLKTKIDRCATDKSLLVLMCHSVVDTNGEGYGIYPNGFSMDDFKAIMDYLKWGNDATKTTQRIDIEVTSLKAVYDAFASIG